MGTKPNPKEWVGKLSSKFRDEASAPRLDAFAAAISAKKRSYSPPTFLTVGRQGEFELLQKMGIPLSRVLHGEQEYEYLRDLRPGETIEYETCLANVLEKRGATPMQFMYFETDFRVGEEVVARARTNIIYRGESS